jgi:hypothetical protein
MGSFGEYKYLIQESYCDVECVDCDLLPCPGGFAVGAEPARRPGEAPPGGVYSKNGRGAGGGGAKMREIGELM